MLHAPRKAAFGGLNYQMVMIVHQAVGMAYPVIARDGLSQKVKKNMFRPYRL